MQNYGNSFAVSGETYLHLDVTSPTVVMVDPADTETDVPVDIVVRATFSEDIDAATITSGTFTLKDSGNNAVAASRVVSGALVTLTPDADLLPLEEYTAELTTTIADLAGNVLASAYTWSFTTAGDTTPPTLSASVPDADAVDVPVDIVVVVAFDEAIDPASVTSSTFRLLDGITPVTATRAVYAGTLTLTPTSPLDPATVYTVELTSGIEDLAGNAFAGTSFDFTTTGDVTDPTLLVTVPTDDAIGVHIDTVVTAVFDESIDPASVTSSTFRLLDGITPVSASRAVYSGALVLTPSSPLDHGVTYTVELTSGILDLAGNAYAGTTFDFTTEAFDTFDLLFKSPPDSSTGVSINATVQAVFTKDVDGGTVDASSFSVKEGGVTPVAGSFSVVDKTITFTPSSPLTAETLYTVDLTTDIEDVDSVPLSAPASWSFTTEVAGDTTAPVVSNVSPTPDVDDPIGRNQVLSFDLTDDSGLFRRVLITATFAPWGIIEVIHTGDAFAPKYLAGSTRSVIVDGFHYELLRDGGWISDPEITIYAIDQSGNEGD